MVVYLRWNRSARTLEPDESRQSLNQTDLVSLLKTTGTLATVSRFAATRQLVESMEGVVTYSSGLHVHISSTPIWKDWPACRPCAFWACPSARRATGVRMASKSLSGIVMMAFSPCLGTVLEWVSSLLRIRCISYRLCLSPRMSMPSCGWPLFGHPLLRCTPEVIVGALAPAGVNRPARILAVNRPRCCVALRCAARAAPGFLTSYTQSSASPVSSPLKNLSFPS